MPSEIYNRVDYKLENMLLDIESGKMGLPDLQRPFVWSNNKVRDLLDSMMLGYPLGFVMLWDAPEDDGKNRLIGTDGHQHQAPKQLIIDGQQRLTSLYAVMYGKEIVDSKFRKKKIKIAYHPIDRKFEGSKNSLRKSPEWIGDISEAYENESNSYDYVNNFISNLAEARQKEGKELTSEEKEKISKGISALFGLKKYQIPTLTITDAADEEDVAEIFKRVNSGGKALNENDFILTLISVHNEQERRRIEKFCESATIPAKSGTAYNQLFEPNASHIVRATMAFGFKRARLRYAYMILRGKDMDTGEYSTELREKKFDELSEYLDKVLDLNNWHEFINCVLSAGYLSKSLISSENALVYTYVMYLLGKYDFKVEAPVLRRTIARWFYMVSITSYYTGSYEADVQQDLNNIALLNTAEQFEAYINNKVKSTFTNDYFNITLPADLDTSSSTAPVWNAYCAAQNVLNVKALFSTLRVRELYAPGSSGTRSSVEKHHLWPKEYLPTIGFKDDRERNQAANFAFIEWKDNSDISAGAPADYWPVMTASFSEDVLKEMMYDNAIPENWTSMTYPDFLEKRRVLMAGVIRRGYETLLES